MSVIMRRRIDARDEMETRKSCTVNLRGFFGVLSAATLYFACDTHSQKSMSKEPYYSVKRDLLQCQKRPTTVSKETYYSVKRDLRCAPDINSQKSAPYYIYYIKSLDFTTESHYLKDVSQLLHIYSDFTA